MLIFSPLLFTSFYKLKVSVEETYFSPHKKDGMFSGQNIRKTHSWTNIPTPHFCYDDDDDETNYILLGNQRKD